MVFIEEILVQNSFSAELIYSFVIIFSSLIIYFCTKEVYKISNHSGIKYFREAFLFFAIAYFFKSFIRFLYFIFNVREIFEFSSMFFGVLTLFFFMYASTMAIFYLFYSVVWKNFKENKMGIPLVHVGVLIVSAIAILMREVKILMLLQVSIFLFITLFNYFSYKKINAKKKPNQIYRVYLFLFIFWMLNLFDLLVVGFGPVVELFISLISIGLFLIILYKVVRNIGFN